MTIRLILGAALLSALTLRPSPALAAPITLTFDGRVTYTGLPIQIPLVSVGNPFLLALTYDSAASLTGPDPNVDTYEGAILAMDVSVETAAGTVRYSAMGLPS